VSALPEIPRTKRQAFCHVRWWIRDGSSTLSKTFNRRFSANIGTGRRISAFIDADEFQKKNQWYDLAL
jgi:hypothetical protein